MARRDNANANANADVNTDATAAVLVEEPSGRGRPRAEAPARPSEDSGTVLQTTVPMALDLKDVGLGLVALFGWIVLMTVGIAIGTQPYLDTIRDPGQHRFLTVLGSGLVVLFCHTVPNIAMLCCLSAFIGTLGARSIPRETATRQFEDRLTAYASSITRGFFVYIIILSGMLIISEGISTNLTQDKYVRLAGLASLFSFTAGYDPQLFARFLQRIIEIAEGRPAARDLSREPEQRQGETRGG